MRSKKTSYWVLLLVVPSDTLKKLLTSINFTCTKTSPLLKRVITLARRSTKVAFSRIHHNNN